MALAHPLHPTSSRSRISAETCGLDDVFPPDDLGSCPDITNFCIYIYVYLISGILNRILLFNKMTITRMYMTIHFILDVIILALDVCVLQLLNPRMFLPLDLLLEH